MHSTTWGWRERLLRSEPELNVSANQAMRSSMTSPKRDSSQRPAKALLAVRPTHNLSCSSPPVSRGCRPAGEREGRKQAAALRKRARESESDGGLESGAHRGSEAGEPRVEGSDRHDDSDAGDDEGEGSEADEPGSVAEAAWGGADA